MTSQTKQCQNCKQSFTIEPDDFSLSHHHGDQPCPNEFETSYAPDPPASALSAGDWRAGRPEIVYCEQCYQSEII